MKSEDETMEPNEQEVPILAKIAKTCVFSVPDNYFEILSQQIKSQIEIHETVSKENGFLVPQTYFEDLTEEVKAAIYLHTIKETLSKDSGFSVPENYFSNSRNQIHRRLKQKTKVRKLSFIRYAAAACILLTTSLGAYFNVQHANSIGKQLSKVPVEEIENYLKRNTDAGDIPMLIENIDGDLEIYNFSNEQRN